MRSLPCVVVALFVGACSSSSTPPVDAATSDVNAATCADLTTVFQCSTSFSTCFPLNPAGDHGPCATDGEVCENLGNCAASGPGLLDWDCHCDPTTHHWMCTVDRVCNAGDAGP